MISAAVKRLEESMTQMGRRLDKLALKSEVLDLKARVEMLERKLSELEAS